MTTPLKQARLDRGESIKELADLMGCHPSHIGRIERGERTPDKELARRLYRHFAGQVALGFIYDADFGQ